MHSTTRRTAMALTLALVVAACSTDTTPVDLADPGVATRTVEVEAVVPHRQDAFTQGLEWHDGALYESAGLVGRSSLARIDPATGEATRVVDVDPTVFAEGLAVVGDRLIQLTWQDGVALVHDLATFDEVARFAYDGEGWGLCHDGDRLVMSDGSARLTFRDPTTFVATDQVTVTLDGTPVDQLNELECVGDRVFANVWHTDRILEIDPSTGAVTTVIDAGALVGRLDPAPTSSEAVLNGIAYDEVSETFWLTGKLWPQLFRVRFVDG